MPKNILKLLDIERMINEIDVPYRTAHLEFIMNNNLQVKSEVDVSRILVSYYHKLQASFYGVHSTLSSEMSKGITRDFINKNYRGGYREAVRDALTLSKGGILHVLTQMLNSMIRIGTELYLEGIMAQINEFNYKFRQEFVIELLKIYSKYLPKNLEPIQVYVEQIRSLLNVHLQILDNVRKTFQGI